MQTDKDDSSWLVTLVFPQLPPWTRQIGSNSRRFAQSPMFDEALMSWRQSLGQRMDQRNVPPLATIRGNFPSQGGATVSEIGNSFNGRFDIGFTPDQLLPRTPVSEFVPVNDARIGSDPGAVNSLASLPPDAQIPFASRVEFQQNRPIRVEPRLVNPLEVATNSRVVGQVGPIPTLGPLGDARGLQQLLDSQHSPILFQRPDVHNGPEIHPRSDVHHVSEINHHEGRHRPDIHHGPEVHNRPDIHHTPDIHLGADIHRGPDVRGPEIHHPKDGHKQEIRGAMRENKQIRKQIKQELRKRKQERRQRKILGLQSGPRNDLHQLQGALQETKQIRQQLRGALNTHKHITSDMRGKGRGKKIQIIDPLPPHPPHHPHHPPPPPPPPQPKKKNPIHALAKGLLIGGLGAMLLGK